MTQMLLDLKPQLAPTFDNFVGAGNAELIAQLQGLADPHCFDAIYLWGGAGSGKSHLLAATAALATSQRPVSLAAGADIGADIAVVPGALLAIDDVHALTDAAQVALFRIFNAARLAGLAILLSGREPPSRLVMRQDLRTRIGQALIFEVKPLTDDDKAAALGRHASMRGMRVDDSLIRYLLSHGRRDLPTLMAALDSLDRATLEQQRAATLPLLKEIMQLQCDDNDEPGTL